MSKQINDLNKTLHQDYAKESTVTTKVNALKTEIMNDYITPIVGEMGSLGNLQTTEKDNLVGAINELFQNVDSGKQLIANAIDDESITKNSTFNAMSEAITKIKPSGKRSLYNELIAKGYEATESMSVNELVNLLEDCDIDPNEVKQIACGGNHTFILKGDGTVWSCGQNIDGQLGLDNSLTKYDFTQVTINIDNDVKQISCGDSHTVILKNDGTVWGCGWTAYGQLGLGGSATSSKTFTKFKGIDSVKEVICGATHTCILKNDGTLLVSGANGYGQLGLGDSTHRYTFTQLTTNVKQVICGNNHTFVLKNDGSVWACGQNSSGQLGLGHTNTVETLTQVTTNINDVKQIACGYNHSYILKNDGSVWSTGANTYGKLGLGDTTNRNTFTLVTTNINNDVKQIACGGEHAVILKNDGSVWVTGYGYNGQLGLGDTTNRNTFTQVTTNINNDVKQVFCRSSCSFILKNDGSFWACGRNNYAQLGLDSSISMAKTFTNIFPLDTSPEYQDKLKLWQFLKNAISLPVTSTMSIEELLEVLLDKGDHLEDVLVDVKGTLIDLMQEGGYDVDGDEDISILMSLLKKSGISVGDIKQISCGNSHTFILKHDGSLWACGDNDDGQLGFGDNTKRNTFTKVTTNINNDVKQIACGGWHTVIIKNDGSLWTCGYNSRGQLGLGNNTSQKTFTKVTTNINNDVKRVACGSQYTFILKNDDSLWSCGNNSYGQLGLDNTSNRTTFTKVTTNINNDVKQIACGNSHTFIIKNDDSLWVCGYNSNGQVGLGTSTLTHNTFTQVTTNVNNDVKQVICGEYSTFILKTDGSIWSCGDNDNGQLGLGDNTKRNTFTKVTTNINNDVKQIACGYYYTVIIKNDGSLWTCGFNDYGQLGLGDSTSRTTFTQVTTNISNIKQIDCGYGHTFILKNDKSVCASGYNNKGQLGLGDTTNRPTFTQVPRGF